MGWSLIDFTADLTGRGSDACQPISFSIIVLYPYNKITHLEDQRMVRSLSFPKGQNRRTVESAAMLTDVASNWTTLKKLPGRRNNLDWINGTLAKEIAEQDGLGAQLVSSSPEQGQR